MDYTTVSISLETKRKLKDIKESEGVDTFEELMTEFINLYYKLLAKGETQ